MNNEKNNETTPGVRDMNTVRAHLLDTMAALKDKANPMEIDRARAISDIAQTLINSAKVEVDFIKATGGNGTGFIPQLPYPISQKLPADTTQKGNVLTHKLRG